MMAFLFPRPTSPGWERLAESTNVAYRNSEAFWIALELDVARKANDLDSGNETYVYVIAEEDGYGPVKIGMATKPLDRLSTLQQATHRNLFLLAAAPGTRELERYLHHVLRRDRLPGEWFRRSRRTLVVAQFLMSAEEQCAEIVRHEEGYTPRAGDTLACFSLFADTVVVGQAA